MYESLTYETILKRMLDTVPSNMDKREGSIIYDAIAPCAVELQLMYIELDVILKETFADTASREFLIRRAAERGITPYEATYAIVQGEFDIAIDIGTRFRCDSLTYIVTEYIDDFIYKLQCETVGSVGNGTFGNLIPIGYINGLTYAEITDILIHGADEEDTEAFRVRYFETFETKTYGGNIADYLEYTNRIDGVGATKVTPVWAGGGTVKLTILNAEYDKASDLLIETVQEIIDPTGDGFGMGIAPIGHTVTVDTVEEISVAITTSIMFDSGYSFTSLQTKINDTIEAYLLELRKEWASSDELIVRIAQIDSRIMNLQGVLDVGSTKINSSTTNLTLSAYEMPVFGGVTNG